MEEKDGERPVRRLESKEIANDHQKTFAKEAFMSWEAGRARMPSKGLVDQRGGSLGQGSFVM